MPWKCKQCSTENARNQESCSKCKGLAPKVILFKADREVLSLDESIVLEWEISNADFVEIQITDNGIGRKKTMEIESEKRNTQKKSIGLKLTKQRLENFSRNFANMHSLNIVDLYDDAQNPLGTKVLLSLPVK